MPDALAHTSRAEGPRRSERTRVHRLVFSRPEETIHAVQRLRQEGFCVDDVYTPFPVHGLPEAMGMPDTRLGWATFVGGLTGGTAMLAFQAWVHVVDWPLVIGGKSLLAWPALIPVTFELTVLCAAFATIGGLFARRRLYPRLDGSAPTLPHPRVTDDSFVVLVVERDASFSPEAFRQLCAELGATEVNEGWSVA